MRGKPLKGSRAEGVYTEREIERALMTFNSLFLGMTKSQIHPLRFLVIKTIKTNLLSVCLNKQQKNLE